MTPEQLYKHSLDLRADHSNNGSFNSFSHLLDLTFKAIQKAFGRLIYA